MVERALFYLSMAAAFGTLFWIAARVFGAY
jgi:hypothetical protein